MTNIFTENKCKKSLETNTHKNRNRTLYLANVMRSARLKIGFINRTLDPFWSGQITRAARNKNPQTRTNSMAIMTMLPNKLDKKKPNIFNTKNNVTKLPPDINIHKNVPPKSSFFDVVSFQFKTIFTLQTKQTISFFLSVFHSDWACLVANLWLLLLPFFVRLRADSCLFLFVQIRTTIWILV